MLIVLLIVALLAPSPAVSFTVDTSAPAVVLLNSDAGVTEIDLTTLPDCNPCRVALPLHELVTVPLAIPTPAPRCGLQHHELIVTGVVVSGTVEMIGASIGYKQVSINTVTNCTPRVYLPG
jgi:hypothetical protein